MSTVLEVRNMNIAFPTKSGERVIVKDGAFEVKSGEFVLILGENGAGKSSIFKSLVREDSSKGFDNRDLYFKGEKIDSQEKLDRFRKSIGYARQEDDPDRFFSRKVWSYVKDYAMMSSYFSSASETESEMERVYNELHCEKYADGDFKNRQLKRCSGGEKRMATILSALSRTKSDLFILDEPINNLDAYHARLLNNYLIKLRESQNAPGILVITHCQMFQKVDRVYKLSKGQLVEIKDYTPKSCFGECDSCGLYLEEN